MVVDKTGPNSPMLINCSEPNCSKKYRNLSGLQYHRNHAHGGDMESNQNNDSGSTPSNGANISPKATTSAKPAPPPPLPTTSDEGIKPSGTSTGPPPAPHQANCYFNQHFLNSSFNPYALGPFFPRAPIYDTLTSPSPSGPAASTAFRSPFMAPMAPVVNSVQYPPFKLNPGPLHAPTSQSGNLPPPPLMNNGGSPLSRMPSQVDGLLGPPGPQPPFPPPPIGLNSVMGLPLPPTSSMAPIGLGNSRFPSGEIDDGCRRPAPNRSWQVRPSS